MTNLQFPKGFYWGAATSAHQVEGNNHNDWTEWEKSEYRIQNLEFRIKEEKFKKQFPFHIFEKRPTPLDLENYISGRACDHYNRFAEDFALAKSLGHNAHRFSIEWSRIEPEEGKFNEKEIEHYREVIKALRERGIEPFVTLWHWTLPLWIRDKGGFKNRKIIKYFCRYAEKIVSEFKNEVNFWITLNEPMVYASTSYLIGIWPPQKKNPFLYLRVIKNLIKSHREVYKIIKNIQPDAQVGIAKNNVYFEGMLASLANWWWNFYFLKKIKNEQDFIGLNYYFHKQLKFSLLKDLFKSSNFLLNQTEIKIVSDMNWEIYPEGIYHVLKDLKKYEKPIYITENGLADAKDAKRLKFIKDHLYWVHKAMKEGADVLGYFHWSLLDNFEWNKGFWPRFGLVEVDYQPKADPPLEGKTMERKIRPSAFEYAKICKENALIL